MVPRANREPDTEPVAKPEHVPFGFAQRQPVGKPECEPKRESKRKPKHLAVDVTKCQSERQPECVTVRKSEREPDGRRRLRLAAAVPGLGLSHRPTLLPCARRVLPAVLRQHGRAVGVPNGVTKREPVVVAERQPVSIPKRDAHVVADTEVVDFSVVEPERVAFHVPERKPVDKPDDRRRLQRAHALREPGLFRRRELLPSS